MTTQSGRRRTLLIAVASRHGSTAAISERLHARLLRDLPEDEWRIDTADCDEISSIEGYDVVILGSAVYLGRWLRPATRLLVTASASPPEGLWLFSSGPIGADALGSEVMPILRHANADLKVVEHVMFAGALDADGLKGWEKGVTTLMRITGGDFRNWDDIDDWASRIATQLVHSDTLIPRTTASDEARA